MRTGDRCVLRSIHGLAFASNLQDLGIGTGQRVATIFGFNLGIEAMQLIVVGAVLPSLLILSRTSRYGALRCTGALFAAAAALGWIVERSLMFSVLDSACKDCHSSTTKVSLVHPTFHPLTDHRQGRETGFGRNESSKCDGQRSLRPSTKG